MEQITVIGDVHGCYETLMRLVEKLPNKDSLCFVGDLIDRGPDSKKVVEFVKGGKYPSVMGNHEELMIRHARENGLSQGIDAIFLYNGGGETLRSYELFGDNTKEKDAELFLEHIEFMMGLPNFLVFEELQDDNGKHLLVSHAPIIEKYSKMEVDGEYCRWNRTMPHGIEEKRIFNIFGHNIVKAPIVESCWASIDTGCFYGGWHPSAHMGFLSAIEFPSKRIFTQECVDDVRWRPY